ncbi:RNase H family protein [Serratia sp. Se-RSBMAAmG]|uniref:RNase H family protein n=1 Tax=Serratia sp. Se-RSBMAAmG TaxID=3043305 RepID=UPI0024AF73FD|nr:RNase H family protein [Serratia sp. Se-RSBMAAmG]MDI6977678.1 hypothetical protein [Serratia sp. Se-RSBMAAmG]
MNIYVGNYDNNFGYLIRKDEKDIEKIKLSTEREADEHRLFALMEAMRSVEKKVKEGMIKRGDTISFYFNDDNVLDYALGRVDKVKASSAFKELLTLGREYIPAVCKEYGISVVRGSNNEEHKQITKDFKLSYLNNAEFPSMGSTFGFSAKNDKAYMDLIQKVVNEAGVIVPKVKVKVKNKVKVKKIAFKDMTPEQQKVALEKLSQEREVIAERYIDRDLSKYREVRLNTNTIPNVISKKVKEVSIYTDGSLYKAGSDEKKQFMKGYGIVIADKSTNKVLFRMRGRIAEQGQILNDINLVELYAIYRATHFMKTRIDKGFFDEDVKINIHTDSLHTVKKFDKVVSGEKSVEEMAYAKIWGYIAELQKEHSLNLGWVKGHSASKLNKEADELAKQGAKGPKEREDLIMFTVLREINDLMDATSHIESDRRRIKPR